MPDSYETGTAGLVRDHTHTDRQGLASEPDPFLSAVHTDPSGHLLVFPGFRRAQSNLGSQFRRASLSRALASFFSNPERRESPRQI